MITGISSLGFSIGYTLGARRARRYTLRGQESDSGDCWPTKHGTDIGVVDLRVNVGKYF